MIHFVILPFVYCFFTCFIQHCDSIDYLPPPPPPPPVLLKWNDGGCEPLRLPLPFWVWNIPDILAPIWVVRSDGHAIFEALGVCCWVWKVAYRPITPVFEILGSAVEVNPAVRRRYMGVRSTTHCLGKWRGSPRHGSGSHLHDRAEHLGDLVAAVDGLATASTSHLVVRLGSDAPLVHVSNLCGGVSLKVLVVLVGFSVLVVVVVVVGWKLISLKN